VDVELMSHHSVFLQRHLRKGKKGHVWKFVRLLSLVNAITEKGWLRVLLVAWVEQSDSEM